MRNLTMVLAVLGALAGRAYGAGTVGTTTGGGCSFVADCNGCNYTNDGGLTCYADISCSGAPCVPSTTTTGGVPELPAGMAGPLTLAVAGAAIYLRRRYVKNKRG